MKQRWTLAILGLLSLGLTGCGHERGAESPEQVVERLLAAKESNDEAAVAAMMAGPEQVRLISAQMELATYRIHLTVARAKQKYGEDQLDAAADQAFATIALVAYFADETDLVSKGEFQIEGDEAKMVLHTKTDGWNSTRYGFYMVKVAGRWYRGQRQTVDREYDEATLARGREYVALMQQLEQRIEQALEDNGTVEAFVADAGAASNEIGPRLKRLADETDSNEFEDEGDSSPAPPSRGSGPP